jgi:DNA-binding CsgD family transcriptional regulator
MGSRLGESTLHKLIGMIYEAAVDLDRWPAFLDHFAQAMNSGGTMIWVHDFDGNRTNLETNSVSFVSAIRFDPAYLDSLTTYYSDRNVWVQNETTLKPGVPVNSSMLYADRDLPRTEWYNDWLRPQGYRYAIGGLVLREANLAVKFTSLRPEKLGEFGPKELRFYAQLLPHLRRACAIYRRLATTQAALDGTRLALDLLPMGVWLFDSAGSVLIANRASKELATRQNGLWLGSDGRPRAIDAAQEKSLLRLVNGAARTGLAQGKEPGGAIAVSRRDGLPPLHLLVSPVSIQTNVAHVAACAVAFISDPSVKCRTPEHLFRQLYGLTNAEAQLASHLLLGKDVIGYAAERELSAVTVRSHLSQVLAKTGTKRQTDLMRLVLSGPLGMRPRIEQAASRTAA